ncbi:hypothetical protein [Neoroseomonas soli]|uniref:Cytochrome c domain-containing protein n=1 Tax=Neoroseomonas soli TaxID=1081025 RepID=A0A9X9WYQ3_9PROT|nr:hypothetical protein [Neoroseomonas soli]MBR0672282.1 hypothetical protein [Neoroseomonas soli]
MRAMLVLATLCLAAPATAQTGADAFARGCGGGCHHSETRVLRAIPRGTDAERRAWIEAFMARHPCHSDNMKPAILDYLTERTRR